MTKENYKNEQKKREFIEYLKGAEGFSQSSMNSFAGAIDQWQTFSKYDDFINFNKRKALGFRDWLKKRESNTENGTISLTTQYNYLRRIKRFFIWLSDQNNYKNKLIKSEIEFLRLSRVDARIARQGTTKRIPTLEETKKIIGSIKIENEIDMRDRAIICFAIITGMRISAITTLRMKNFNLESKKIDQNPADGIRTKNSKRIITTFFPIGWNDPQKYFLEWYKHLESKGFQSEDPIFPATINDADGGKFSYSRTSVGNEFWSGSNGARKIFEKRCINAKLPYFNPHSFRHLVVKNLSKMRLTEEEKKAVSLNLGHANTGTTFGSYGYGNMTDEDAIEIVKKINCNEKKTSLSSDEIALLKKIIDKVS